MPGGGAGLRFLDASGSGSILGLGSYMGVLTLCGHSSLYRLDLCTFRICAMLR